MAVVVVVVMMVLMTMIMMMIMMIVMMMIVMIMMIVIMMIVIMMMMMVMMMMVILSCPSNSVVRVAACHIKEHGLESQERWYSFTDTLSPHSHCPSSSDWVTKTFGICGSVRKYFAID